MLISIVLPSLNEEKGIKDTLDAIPKAALEKLGHDLEILVIDGGSQDRTREIAKEGQARVLQAKPGYGRQYLLGFKYAKGDIIVTADSDGSYPLEEICDYINILIYEDLDFISTNRFANMNRANMRTINKLGNMLLTLLNNILFNLSLRDSQSGMWIMKRNALNKLKLTSQGMALSEEIKIEAFKKLNAREIPSTYFKREGSAKLNIISDGVRNIMFLVKKRLLMEK